MRPLLAIARFPHRSYVATLVLELLAKIVATGIKVLKGLAILVVGIALGKDFAIQVQLAGG